MGRWSGVNRITRHDGRLNQAIVLPKGGRYVRSERETV